ncbi:MAG: hypothetical protein IKO35_00385, partial [Elusimicrobiaceae bacterium]|nr:hypothetical protein [Elusimicrobiaceae bacterium]
ILNKSDLSVNVKLDLAQADQYKQLAVSCKKGTGIEPLKKELAAPLQTLYANEGLIISNLRHYESLLRAQTELESALIQVDNQAGGEIYAEHLRGALRHLKDLTGEVTPDDILGIIFSKFCMGK